MNLSHLKRYLGMALLGLTSITLLVGCSSMLAQNPSSAMKPFNAVPEGDSKLMLKGFDVVSYFTQNQHAMGQARFSSVYEGITFRFANAQHKALFDANPKKYQPEYGGFCANGIGYGIPWGGDGDTWRMVNGRLFIFGGQGSKDAFELDIPGNTALADKYWKEEVAGSNSFIQRTWRLTLRVPHYKNGEELARDVAAAKAKKS